MVALSRFVEYGVTMEAPEAGALLAARMRLRLTQPQFADALASELGRPVDRTQVTKWEAGVYQPRPQVVMAAARLAGLTPRELMAEGAQLGDRPRRRRGRTTRPGGSEEPKALVRALLELGFTLPEAIELVRSQAAATGSR